MKYSVGLLVYFRFCPSKFVFEGFAKTVALKAKGNKNQLK